MVSFIYKSIRSRPGRLGLTVLAVIIGLISLRFILATPVTDIHYHADFAIFINGQRLDLSGPAYAEENNACNLDSQSSPTSRAHLHEPHASVVHVHDQAVTWGHFLANLGFSLDNDRLRTRDRVFESNRPDNLRFILNDQPIQFLKNRVIGRNDRLLIDYSSDSEAVLKDRYQSIETLASTVDQTSDPGSCGGNQARPGFWNRLKPAIKLWDY